MSMPRPIQFGALRLILARESKSITNVSDIVVSDDGGKVQIGTELPPP